MKKKRLAFYIILPIVACIAMLGVVVLFSVVLLHNNILSVLTNYKTYLWAFGLLAAIIFYELIDYRVHVGKRVLKINADLENSRWLTEKEMKHNQGFTAVRFSRLGEVAAGVPIATKTVGHDMDIILKKPSHVLTIGATRTGKTTSFVAPTIVINAHTATKPSMVITDPKGELCRAHQLMLENLGYKVSIIDLVDIFHSTQWNPLGSIAEKTKRLQNLKVEQKSGRYYLNGKEYQLKKEADQKLLEIRPELENDIFLDLQDVIYAMCPIDSKNEPSWQLAARSFIFGIALALWEDVRDGYMPIEKFTLYNLYKNISEYATDDCTVLKNYVLTRAPESKVKSLTNTVLVSQDRTLASYLGEVNRFITWLADSGITALTGGNDINFSKFDEEPNALFFKIPETKDSRYQLVSLFLLQLYKELTDKSDKNMADGKCESPQLMRDVMFIMDEFGNLPRLYKIENIVTIGAGRKIFLMPIIQDFPQLERIYGKNIADTVRSNCNTQIFIGTNDKSTREVFSELCGKHKVRQVSYSENKDMSVSTSAQSVPLIYPSELEKLNDTNNGVFGNMIVSSLGSYPIKTKMVPVFQAKELFEVHTGVRKEMPFIDFNERKEFYDIATTAAFLLLGDGEKVAVEDETVAAEVQPSYTPPQKKSEVVLEFQTRLQQKLNKLKAALPTVDYKAMTESNNPRYILGLLKKVREKSDNEFLIVEIIKIEKFITSQIERGIDDDKN